MKINYINPDKLERAKERVGVNATDKQILAEYLKMGGLAKNEKGEVISSYVDEVEKPITKKAKK